MRFPASLISTLGLLTTMTATPWAAAPEPVRYHAKVVFEAGKDLKFPDFVLRYLGAREVAPPPGLRGWTVYDFAVQGTGEPVKISWSAGTGDIGPTPFRWHGGRFLLELRHSDTLGKLQPHELVIRPQP